ncbi:MAG TPA: tetratricopeptide repeat protein, partial [Pyrinomonadaceae bacterium]|nr:tetratricopeptide repeat protein [Pyrinomonadaceae bacterium]
GRLLNVSSVLEGSVRMAGKRVRIAVQLVNVLDGFHLWSETYDRTLEDIFEIQDNIAQSVVGELRSRLVGKSMDSGIGKAAAAEVAGAAKGRTQIPEAHRLRLLARHLVDRRTKADVPAALEYLQKALELDPGNALCWVEFGNAHFMAGLFTWDEAPLKYFESARRAAEKALSIDPDLAVGHALLARIQSKFEWDLSSAEASVRRAEELAPEDPFVLGSVGLIKLQMGRLDEAIEVLHRGLLFDPLNISIFDNLSYATLGLGLLNEAETAERRALEIVPQKPCSHAYLSLVMLEQGRIEEARAEAGAEPDESWRLWAAAIVENAAGRPDEARSALDELILKYAYDSAFQIAEVYSIFGQTDEAFKWLDTAIAQRDGGMTQLKWSTLMRPLHSDPRWLPLLKKVGFPDENA